jgi:hypothetical protein
VYLQAQQPEGALRLKDKALDGGSVALATPTTLTAQLKNTGTRASAFRVLPNDRVKISPERCKLAPDEVGQGRDMQARTQKTGRQMHKQLSMVHEAATHRIERHVLRQPTASNPTPVVLEKVADS